MAATKVQRKAKKTKPSKPADPVAKARVATKGAANSASPAKGAAKAGTARPAVAVRKSAAKAATAKPPAGVKKSAAKGPATAKPAPAKNTVTKKPIAKKTIAKKPIAKKAIAKKTVPEKTVAKKTVAKKVDVTPIATKPSGAKSGVRVAPKSPPKKLELKTQGEVKGGKPAGKVMEPKATAKPKKVAAQLELADWASAPPKADTTTPARDARQLLEQRKAIKNALAPSGDGKSIVDAYMRDVDHPFKAEIEAVRQIILGVSPKLSERIKWNAPSFYYKEDLGAFNPRSSQFAHLILLFPDGGALPEKSAILEGNHKDRREVKFHSMDDVKSKQRALEKIIKDWVDYRDLR